MSTDGTTLGFLHDEGKPCFVFRFRLPTIFGRMTGVLHVFFTSSRFFYPWTSRTTSVCVDSPIDYPREIQIMWSQNYATEILRCHVPVCSMHSGYDRHDIRIL